LGIPLIRKIKVKSGFNEEIHNDRKVIRNG